MKDNRIIIGMLSALAMLLMTACANISGAPGGGPRDVLPPVMVASEPPQGTVDFQSRVVTMEFDEFVELRDQDKIYTSPVLNKVSYSYMLKKVKVEMDDTLRPDYTYTIRFGNSLVDLHEANPIPDFHYVFSTGAAIDSAFLAGRVVKAVDYRPEDRVRLLFYLQRPDSFPFNDEPDYVSIGDKEGYFQVIHMKEGCYYVYAVVDDNQDYRIDPVTEMMAYTDSCIVARHMAELIALPETVDTLGMEGLPLETADTIDFWDDALSIAVDTSAIVPDTLPVAAEPIEPALELYLYRDYLPAFFVKELAFKQRGKLECSFYYPVDSIEAVTFIEINDTLETEVPLPLNWRWAADRRSAVVQFPHYGLTQADIVLQVGGNIDTTSVYLADAAIRKTDTAAFRLSAKAGKLLVSDSLVWQSDFPFGRPDTARMAVWRFVQREQTEEERLAALAARAEADSLAALADRLSPVDTVAPAADSLPVMVIDTIPQPFGLLQVDAWTWALRTPQEVGGQYALFLQDSAVFDFFGRPNDTAVFNWQVVAPDEGGDLALDLQGLEPGAVYVLQLVEGSEQIRQEIRVTDTGYVEFLALKPAQYTFRLFKDDNDNGQWDEGDYVRRVQPEKHWYYHKTLRVEADWRIEDIWRIE